MSEQTKIARLRRIVAEWQHGKVEGRQVDAYSASAILAVYDGLNETNRARFAAMPVAQMSNVAFKLLAKSSGPRLGTGRARLRPKKRIKHGLAALIRRDRRR